MNQKTNEIDVQQGRGGISAQCIAASIHKKGPPVYTFVTRSPKFIDAEMRTHRVLSQSSSSSRAIPVSKIIEQVENDPFIPFEWRKNQSGMQGYELVTDEKIKWELIWEWLEARDNAVETAKKLSDKNGPYNVHKQTINRLLEPFMFQWKVITGTEWDNFFSLRIHPAAQPEIQELAKCIKDAMESAVPIDLSKENEKTYPHDWHLPFVLDEEKEKFPIDWLLDLSAARCARASYANHGTKNIDIIKDFKLAKELKAMGHASPFEHQCRPLFQDGDYMEHSHLSFSQETEEVSYWSGNFREWLQYRKVIERGTK